MDTPNNDTNDPLPRDLSGRRLGDYQLLRLLGRGAMAQVYLAEQLSLQRQVALKVLKHELVDDETYVARFQREARSAALLSHANIVQIHDVGCIEGVYYIAQEYVDGTNLQQWMTRHGTIDLQMALVIMWQVASALAKAAEQGIVHRDIKPENILLAKSGEVKVADFGLARIARVSEDVDLTQIGMTLGTPLYMSPEQIEGEKLDPRSDIYSFGVTCYHMLAGEPPFRGETALSVAVQHIRRAPKPLESIRPDLPAALARVIHQMLAKEPDKRPTSARQLQRELREIQRKHGDDDWPDHLPDWSSGEMAIGGDTTVASTQRLSTLMKAEAKNDSRHRHRRWAIISLLAAACLLLGAGIAHRTVVQEPPLLVEQSIEPAQFATVGEHWLYATQRAAQTGSIDGWEELIERYPEEKYWVARARRQLACHYVARNDLDRAEAIFLEFEMLGDTQPNSRAFGLAGLSWLAAKNGDYDRANDHLDQLWQLRSYTSDDRQLAEIRYLAIMAISAEKGESATKQWEEWLQEEELKISDGGG